jgi:hypothetical protein
MKHGCCTDKACTPGTCMELPEGQTCEDCVHVGYCTGLGVTTRDRTSCDWFPRRFKVVRGHVPNAGAQTSSEAR